MFSSLRLRSPPKARRRVPVPGGKHSLFGREVKGGWGLSRFFLKGTNIFQLSRLRPRLSCEDYRRTAMLHDPGSYSPPLIIDEIRPRPGREGDPPLPRRGDRRGSRPTPSTPSARALWTRPQRPRAASAPWSGSTRSPGTRWTWTDELTLRTPEPLGARARDRPAADHLPVEAPAGRHGRQSLDRVPPGHPLDRLRHRRGRGHRPHRRGQRDRLAALPRPDQGARGHREDQDAQGHPRREDHGGRLRDDAAISTRTSLPVRKVGQTHIWFTPWDYLIRWWGIEEAMIDMIDRPDMVHAAYERMVDAWMVELDQFVEQNLLSLDCANIRVGSVSKHSRVL